MEFENRFDVPLPPDRAWEVLMDVERIAPCMPGATLTEIVDERTFRGTVAVRLGPVSLTFEGEARFEEIDADARTARVRADGRDPKGRGGAGALVDFGIAPSEAGSTVTVATDLTLSGSVAQYGRGVGMIQSVANQLIGQFAGNLAAEIENDPGPGPGEAAPPEDAAPAAPVGGFGLLWKAVVDRLRGLFGG